MATLFHTVDTRYASAGRLSALSVLYARFAELDPLAAFDHAMANGMSLQSPWSIAWADAIFREWARQDLEAAVDFAAELGPTDVPLAAILSARPDLSPARRSAIIRRLSFDNTVDKLPTAANLTALVDDPKETFTSLDPSDGEARRAAAMVWTLRDGRLAIDALSASPDATSALLVTDMISVWASSAPQDALAWALTRDAGEMRNRYVSAALAGVAAGDPAQAAHIAAGLADADARESAVASVLSRWARQDSAATIAWFGSLSDPDTRRRAVRVIAGVYGRQNPAAAAAWARGLPPYETDVALSGILPWMAHDAPEAALAHLQNITNPAARSFATKRTVSEWAKSDPHAAYGWARERADPAERDEMIETALFSWGVTNRTQLMAMIQGITDRVEYEQAIRTAWKFLSAAELEAAYPRNSDQALKRQVAQHLHRTLGWTDPAAAEAFAESAGLDDGQR